LARCWANLNLPFKPEGQPDSVQIRDPELVNILTALAENENAAKNENDAERRAIALVWLFHLVGDIHQPLHTAQLFTVEYGRSMLCRLLRAHSIWVSEPFVYSSMVSFNT